MKKQEQGKGAGRARSGSLTSKLTAASAQPRYRSGAPPRAPALGPRERARGGGASVTPGLRRWLPGPRPRGPGWSPGLSPRPRPRRPLVVAALEARSLPGRTRPCGSPGEAAAGAISRPRGLGAGPAEPPPPGQSINARGAGGPSGRERCWQVTERGRRAPRPVRRAPGSGRARSPSHAVLAHAARALQPAQLRQLPAVRSLRRGPPAGSGAAGPGVASAPALGGLRETRPESRLAPTDRPQRDPTLRVRDPPREAGLRSLVPAGAASPTTPAGAERASLAAASPGPSASLSLLSPLASEKRKLPAVGLEPVPGSLVPCSLPLSARSLSEPRVLSSVLAPAEGRVSGERGPALGLAGRRGRAGAWEGPGAPSHQVVLRV